MRAVPILQYAQNRPGDRLSCPSVGIGGVLTAPSREFKALAEPQIATSVNAEGSAEEQEGSHTRSTNAVRRAPLSRPGAGLSNIAT